MARIENAQDLTEEAIAALDAKELVDSVIYTFDIDEIERARVQALMKLRAKELKLGTEIAQMIRAYNKAEQINAAQYTREQSQHNTSVQLVYDSTGLPRNTIDNYIAIMRDDPHYANIRYNLLANAPEKREDGLYRRWIDADEAESRMYIEKNYGIYHEKKHDDALRILLSEREYHPVQDIIERVKWDGIDRIEAFLHTWMKAEDTPYTREVSRLIFAGGINRLYNPGCKFDDVPVLIGTNQGEGKSSLVRWLAIRDEFYTEVTEIEGQRGIEQLDGAWICEIGELLALTRAKEQEAVKSYISRQKDKYRRPWDRRVSEYPRQCVFIGTTNIENFLKDKTGNRRFYPVRVHSDGYWLFDHEDECRAYILQCWAEARERYVHGAMPNSADRSLIEEFRSAQYEAMEDDWRIGAIEKYLSLRPVGSLVCIRQLKREALCDAEHPQDPTPKESQEISIIMNAFPEWERTGRINTPGYGRQRCWRRVCGDESLTSSAQDLPFRT